MAQSGLSKTQIKKTARQAVMTGLQISYSGLLPHPRNSGTLRQSCSKWRGNAYLRSLSHKLNIDNRSRPKSLIQIPLYRNSAYKRIPTRNYCAWWRTISRLRREESRRFWSVFFRSCGARWASISTARRPKRKSSRLNSRVKLHTKARAKPRLASGGMDSTLHLVSSARPALRQVVNLDRAVVQNCELLSVC